MSASMGGPGSFSMRASGIGSGARPSGIGGGVRGSMDGSNKLKFTMRGSVIQPKDPASASLGQNVS
jgi:hypothetical protein